MQTSLQSVPVLYSGPPFPLKFSFHGESGPPSNSGSLDPLESSTQTAFRSVQLFCKAHWCDRQTYIHTGRQTDRQTDRSTDRANRSVIIDGISYVRSTAMRPIMMSVLWCCRHDHSHCERVHPVYLMNTDSSPSPRWPSTLRPSQPTWAYTGCYRPHPTSPFVVITQPEAVIHVTALQR